MDRFTFTFKRNYDDNRFNNFQSQEFERDRPPDKRKAIGIDQIPLLFKKPNDESKGFEGLPFTAISLR